MTAEPWFKDGLRFSCTQCGNCCTGAPGTVQVTDQEITALATHLDMSEHDFRSVYTRRIGDDDISIKEKSNHECIFYDATKGCTVYPVRPRQCRTWPFWQSVVRSPASWALEAASCPGMNHGTLHGRSVIEAAVQKDGTFGKK